MKTLIVIAHLDDESFGLGGTLLKMCKKNADDIKIISFCDGRSGDNKIQRREAFDKVIKTLGCHYKICGFDDLTLESLQLNILADIIKVEIEKFQAEMVICTSIDDIHQDHVITSKATRIACRPNSISTVMKLLEFKIPGSSDWGTNPEYNIAVNISNVLQEKLDLCNYYESELTIDGINTSSLSGIYKINVADGTKFGLHCAELLRIIWSKCL